ncbi:hypothetical protein HPB50_006728 [Hyalomma asiaticum]|uniref:Uncharacterized protein n=1 Tax=Hyalomma asiaticum TaxID=266040 RepID=A0ACB7TI19_HYAAI|nr:hypothetical protein HPB50_006728 [Hyalomma asiaticum]
MKKLDTIQEKLAKHDAMLSEISDKLGKAERQIENLNEAVEQHGNEVKELANEVQELKTKNVDLENRSRRANLVFYGVKDDKGETWEQSEELIKDICLSRLAINLTSVQRAHRIGRFNKKYNRPIIVNFASDKEKMDVLKNAKKFKGSDYSVDQDCAPETREIRKRLWNYAKTELAESSSKVRLSFDKLIVDGKAFAWDKAKEKVQLASGVAMPQANFVFITKSGQEMRVAREMTRFFWTVDEMKVRCLTGQVCRRTPDSTAKQPATPAKITAIMNTVEKVVAENPCDVPAVKRRANARKALRDLFAEMMP